MVATAGLDAVEKQGQSDTGSLRNLFGEGGRD